MREPNAPFLELTFYVEHTSEWGVFERLISELAGIGAKFVGTGYAHRGPGIRETPFGSIHDLTLEPVRVDSTQTLRAILANPDIRLVQVLLEGATGLFRGVAEIVTYQSISGEAVGSCSHPIAVWSEGEVFSGRCRKERAGRATTLGRRVYQRFRVLVGALRPAYAAITIETGLECPAELRRDPRSYAFRNFFVSQAYLGERLIDRVRDLYAGAYIEPMADGIYISCDTEFNPRRRELSGNDVLRRSVEVAKLIASAGW